MLLPKAINALSWRCGIDASVFTAGIGENNDVMRSDIVKTLKFLGTEMNEEENKKRGEARVVSTPDSKVKVCVIPTNEELSIARQTLAVIEK